MAIDQDGNVIDPYGGRKDLKNGVLRHTSDAFAEDPVRVLRIARFAARYKFTVHQSTMDLLRQIVSSEDFDHLTAERVWKEFEKGLTEKHPEIMYQVLVEAGVDRKLHEFFGNADIHSYAALSKAAQNNYPLSTRFSIMGSGFVNADQYHNWRIPANCSAMNSLVHSNYHAMLNYDSLTPEEKIQLFNRMDAFRREDRMIEVIACTNLITDAYGEALPNIIEDMYKASEVDQASIANATSDKSKIKDAIFSARVKALTLIS
jgi:tRNA nucleotidyltransferase (CCA-adding enzyme)